MKKSFIVADNFIGSRLDRWLRINICKIPQSLIEKNIRRGNIKVNKKILKSSYKLKRGDNIVLFNINYSSDKNKKKIEKYIPTKKDLSFSNDIYINNNDNFVVINKPAGIAVQSGTKSRKNIIDILKSTKEFLNHSPFSVHRIDKDTTGILLVAKNREYAQLLTSLFRIRKIYKTYLSIVVGELKNKKGTFKDTLINYEGNKEYRSPAVTHYNVIDSNNNYSFLKLNPETGRKHQLRKQLLLRGHPILGDQKYR